MADCLQFGTLDEAALLAAVVLAGMLATCVWVRRQGHFFGKACFLISNVAMVIWLGFTFLELMSVKGPCKIFWSKMAWPSIVLVPSAWALFLLDYAFGRASLRKPWKVAMLWLGPTCAGIAVATNDWHFLFYGPDTRMEVVSGRPSVVYDHGPLFFLFAGYVYLFVIAGIFIAGLGMLRAHKRYRVFFTGLLSIAAVPAAGNLGYIFFDFTIYGFDPTPFLFSFVLMTLAWMIFNRRIVDINAVAKDLLFYNTSDPILIFDIEGRLAGCNPEAKRLFRGVLPPLGADIREMESIGPIAAEVLQWQGNVAQHELVIGSRHFDLRAAPIDKPLDRNRAIMGWVLSMIDVTERRYLSAALVAERDYLSKLMDTSMSGILALDENGQFVFANLEAERILGLTLEQMRGMRYDDPAWRIEHASGGAIEGQEAAIARILTNREPTRDLRVSFQRADGERRVLSINTAPLSHPDMAARVVMALADITEQVRAENELRHVATRAEMANRTKSQFLANMSHEIRTPLNGVLGMAEVLDRSVDNPEHKRMVATIRRSGELLLTILNDVLDMSKIEAGKLDLESVPFLAGTIAARIDELHAQGAEDKGLALEIFTSGATDMARLGDPHRVTQVLQNLVSNAIKFTQKGEVTVTFLCPRGKPLVIEVRDTGIGMTPEQAARIFEEFEQADGSVTRRFGGTGLGMSIVRRLTELMGGTVSLETRVGRGTTVRVSLPLPEVEKVAAEGG